MFDLSNPITQSTALGVVCLLALGYVTLLVAYIKFIADTSESVAELHRWRTACADYQRWLREFPDVSTTLQNLQEEVAGTQDLDASHPPGDTGPWTVSGLRDVLLRRRAFVPLQLVPARRRK